MPYAKNNQDPTPGSPMLGLSVCARTPQPVTACHRARGFVFEPGSGQCKPGLWLHQGSGERVVLVGSVDTHFVNTFLPDQLEEFCQDGFE
ncbi:hypothetical protein PoB_003621200 [Plakobranchus ocellatus]|uniref:Uncharacterized protein n=1 Tax=Plakobranchus ocellatus TaxID=259542 RepID=A0AAV4ARZ4_9GAST|nr:hypothetical protein PoB_003621200 [Plakobranchus ocellatus]